MQEWSDFLAFLAGRRSPYVTVGLFPKATADQDEEEEEGKGKGGEMVVAKSLEQREEEERRGAVRGAGGEEEEELQVGEVDEDAGATPK